MVCGPQGVVFGGVAFGAWHVGVAYRGVVGGVACGHRASDVGRGWRGPTLQGLIPAFRMRTLWKAGPHLHGRPGRGEWDAPASPDTACTVDPLP